MPERAAAVTKMEAFAKTQEARLKAMADEYKAKRATAEAPPTGLSKTERDVMLRELQDLEQRIMSAQEKAEEDMAKMEQELLLPVVQKANEAIRTVATEQQFTYVIDSSVGLLMIHHGTDLMAAVKAKLGIK
jgi:outer membrane protein